MNKSKTLLVLFVSTLLSSGLAVCIHLRGANIFEALPHSLSSFIGSTQTTPSFNHLIIDNNGPTNIWQKSVGDINGDGLMDLIAGGRSGGGLVWYRNPDWAKQIIDTNSNFSTDAEVGDIDGDGDNDVVTLTKDGDALKWYENPTWTAHTIDNRTLHDIEIADFDRDGDIDIVTRDQGEFGHQGDELHFYRQDSPAAWTHRSVSIPNGEGLHTADLDRDGDLDVIIGGSWFENNQDIVNGSWTQHIYTNSWTHDNAFIGSGDINGDNRRDIVLAPAELEGETYRIAWFEAPANPKQANWVEHIVEDNVEAVHHFVGVADMNNDGLLDIAAAEMQQGDNPDEVKIYLNQGQNQPWQKQVIATSGSHSMRIVDVDNDGDADLYGANWQGAVVELWENQTCPPTLDNWQRYVIDDAKPWQSIFITAADMDGDNLQDIITGGWWYKNPGNRNGVWTRQTIGVPLNNMAAVYDFDGDGDWDILGTAGQAAIGSTPNSDTFVWARNNGSGVFSILNNIEAGDGDFLQGVAIKRFQTGAPLQVALSWHEAGKGVQTLTLPTNPISQTWIHTPISSTSQDEDLSAGDIDRDGDIDLLLGTKWLRNNGASWTVHTLNNTAGNPDRNHLADMNDDGRLDAVIGFEAINTTGKLAWYEQGAVITSTWSEHVIANMVGPMSLDVADIDRDTDLDVIVGEHNLANPTSAKLYIFENENGQGTSWASHVVYTGDEHHDGAQVIDIDGDGDLDIISIGWGHDDVLLYENLTPKCTGASSVWLPTVTLK